MPPWESVAQATVMRELFGEISQEIEVVIAIMDKLRLQ
jgi:hypothetical protein